MSEQEPKKASIKKHVFFLVFFLFCAWMAIFLAPDVPENGDIERSVSTPSRDLPLPPAKPREASLNPFDRPFLFHARATAKMSETEREKILWDHYHRVVRGMDGKTVPPVEVDEINGLLVVKIDNEPFVTVLPEDCPEYYSTLTPEGQDSLERAVAKQWAKVLREELQDESEMRSTEYRAAYPYLVIWLLAVAGAAHVVSDLFSRRVLNSPGWSLKLLVWLVFLAVACLIHPDLKSVALALSRGALMPVFLGLVIATVMSVCYQVLVWLLQRYLEEYLSQRGRSDRLVQRLKTIGQGVRFTIATIAVVGGLTWFLVAIGLPVSQFLTGAGIAGVLLGVIGRDIFLDYFYGFSVLLEDKYGVDDWIESGTHFGQVVRFHLRATQIREIDGGLTSLSNGEMRIVKNHTRLWALADFRIAVSYECTPDRALELLKEEIEELRKTQPEQIEGEPSILAIQELNEHGMMLRALLKTAPGTQWNVKRELNRRVLNRFSKEGYPPAVPQRNVRWEGKEVEPESEPENED